MEVTYKIKSLYYQFARVLTDDFLLRPETSIAFKLNIDKAAD